MCLLSPLHQIKSGEVVFDEEESRLEKSTFDFKIPVISRQNSAKVFPEIDFESQEVRKKKLRAKLKLSLTGQMMMMMMMVMMMMMMMMMMIRGGHTMMSMEISYRT